MEEFGQVRQYELNVAALAEGLVERMASPTHTQTCKAQAHCLWILKNILLAIHSGPHTAQAAPAAWPRPTLSHCAVESCLHFSKRKKNKTKQKNNQV